MNIEFSTVCPTSAQRFLNHPAFSGYTQEQKEFALKNLKYGVRVQDPMMYGQASHIVVYECFIHSYSCNDCSKEWSEKTWEKTSSFDTAWAKCPHCESQAFTKQSMNELPDFTESLEYFLCKTDKSIARERFAHSKYDYFCDAQKEIILKNLHSIKIQDPNLLENPVIQISGPYSHMIQVMIRHYDKTTDLVDYYVLNHELELFKARDNVFNYINQLNGNHGIFDYLLKGLKKQSYKYSVGDIHSKLVNYCTKKGLELNNSQLQFFHGEYNKMPNYLTEPFEQYYPHFKSLVELHSAKLNIESYRYESVVKNNRGHLSKVNELLKLTNEFIQLELTIAQMKKEFTEFLSNQE